MRTDNNNNQDYYIGGNGSRNIQNISSRSSNLAKYGKMNIDFMNSNNNNKISSLGNIRYGDSISNFQQELERMSNKLQFKSQKKYLQRKKRAYTQIDSTQDQYSSRMNPVVYAKKQSTKQLQSELDQIKKMIEQQSRVNSLQSRLERFYNEIQRKNSQNTGNNLPQQMPNNFMYPPQYNYYPPPPQYGYPPQEYVERSQRSKRKPSDDMYSDDDYIDKHRTKRQSSRLNSNNGTTRKSNTKPVILSKNRIVSLLKKHFFAVTFISFLKKQSKKLALTRKNNLRKFWLQKFDSQVLNMKNWMLDGLKYSISIVLQKRQLNFNFFNESRQKVKRQKQKLLLQLAYLSVQQIKKLSTPKDVSLFSEILVIVCKNGSFPISRFWTVNQMQKIRISQYFGFVRSDIHTQKFLLTAFVFIKVLIFNMLLQPYKFDSLNFKKNAQPLLSNMYLFASLLYHIVKQVIEEELNQPKLNQMYEPGNWLAVKKQFICECCQPLKFNTAVPQQGEYISGMLQRQLFDQMLQQQQNIQKWGKIKQRMKQVIDSLYKQMQAKSKMLRNNLKYKMYN